MVDYTPPKSDLGSGLDSSPKREKLGKVLSYLSLPSVLPIAGAVMMFYKLVDVFEKVTLFGDGDPKILAGEISQSLVSLVLSVFLALPSYLCIFAVLFLTTFRSKAFFRFWVFVPILMIVAFPIGTLFGCVLATALFFKRKEFI